MSDGRLYGLQPLSESENYSSQLLKIISKYVQRYQQKNPDSLGIKRALALKMHITRQLLEVEKINERQLLWRMLDYVGMEKGYGRLDTSTKLRAEILNHLCRYLKINARVIQDTFQMLQVDEIKVSMCMNVPSGEQQFSASHELETQAALHSARAKILELPVASDAVENNVAYKLLGVIQAYENTANRWFAASGIARAARLRYVMTDQWIAVEKLNEYQLLCRLYEHLKFPAWSDKGLIGNSRDLRGRMLTAICQHLELDEASITVEVRQLCGERVVPFSHLGPVLLIPEDQMIEMAVRLNHIAQALTHRMLQQYVIVEDLQTKSKERQMVCDL